jgi:hypothetical protein
MEFLIVWIVYGLIFAAPRIIRRIRAVEEETLCLACANAVVTRGVSGQKLVACNFAGAMRPVKFAVRECTGFCPRGGVAKLVTIEGFAPDKREVYAKVAIR